VECGNIVSGLLPALSSNSIGVAAGAMLPQKYRSELRMLIWAGVPAKKVKHYSRFTGENLISDNYVMYSTWTS
jgi:hypothetical protein